MAYSSQGDDKIVTSKFKWYDVVDVTLIFWNQHTVKRNRQTA